MTIIKTQGKLPKIGKLGMIGSERAVGGVRLTGLTGGGIRKADLLPEELRAAAGRIGEKRAKQVWNLQQKGIQGTLPELCAYDWLESHKRTFEFQSHQMGGRLPSG